MTRGTRAFAGSLIVSGGGGSVPVIGNFAIGPDFGEASGNDGVSYYQPSSSQITNIALQTEHTQAANTQITDIALQTSLTQASSFTGTVLGAPFWQSVETFAASAATTTAVVNKPVGTAENDLLLAFVGQSAVGVSTFTPPAGWTSIEKKNVGATVKTAECFYKLATASEPATYTFASSNSAAPFNLEVHRVRGVDLTTPINVSNSTTLAATSLDPDPDTPSVTTTAINCLIMSYIYHDHLALAQTHTPPASHLEVTDFESVSAGTRCAHNTAWRVFATAGATGTAEHNCTETVATDAIMMRVAIAPGTVIL